MGTFAEFVGLLRCVGRRLITIFESLNDAIEGGSLDIFELALEVLVNLFVQLSETFPEF